MNREILKDPKKFEQKVEWNFKFAMQGFGRNCREALIFALKRELERVKTREYSDSDLLAIENHEVVSVCDDCVLEE